MLLAPLACFPRARVLAAWAVVVSGLSLALVACLPSDFADLSRGRGGQVVPDACVAMLPDGGQGLCDASGSLDAQAPAPSDAGVIDAAPSPCTGCQDAAIDAEPPVPEPEPDASPSCAASGVCTPGQTRECDNFDECGWRVCSDACEWGPCEPRDGAECLRIGPGHTDQGSNYRCCGTFQWQFCLPNCKWSDECKSCKNCPDCG